jgi:uncharacterized protein YkwD
MPRRAMGDHGEMRKPLVVVCSVAAVLLAAGIATTAAGADETPDVPSIPGVALSGEPELPDGQDAAGGLQSPDPSQPDPSQPDPSQPDPSQAGMDQAAQDQAAVQAQGDNAQQPGGTDATGGPADGGDATGGPAGGGDAKSNRAGRPVAQAAVRQPAQQQPAALLAAAQRDVVPGSVSTSAAAPVQQQVLSLVNVNRRQGGCGDLALDRRLITAAFGHAADMARRRYFAHESPNGEGAGDRVQDAGYKWSRYGENIARGPDSAYEVVDGWMHSPEHRENILDCRLHQMGIGLAFDADRTPYWVQDFGTPW